MILYHGSNVEIERVDLAKCRPFKDFGKGFYTTIYPDQAETMAKRTARIYGGEPVVTSFQFDDDCLQSQSMHIKKFAVPNDEWTLFVMNNRNKTFKDVSNPACNVDCKYDIVEGPVANDDLVALLNLYLAGTISLGALQNEMTYRKLTNQISFHTERAVASLKYKGADHG
jgi:hypothetical protein